MLPVSQPKLSQREIDYVTDAVKSGWVSSLGEYIGAFERSFADFCGTRYAVSVCNGTGGLHLALKVLGIGEGDEVIVPDLTFVATANAVKLARGSPIMVDVCRDTYCIDPAKIKRQSLRKYTCHYPGSSLRASSKYARHHRYCARP